MIFSGVLDSEQTLWEGKKLVPNDLNLNTERTLHPLCPVSCVPPLFDLFLHICPFNFPCTFIPSPLTRFPACSFHSYFLSVSLSFCSCPSLHLPPPLLLWTSWAAENTEPEDRMSGSQLPWKAMGRHHACIRPDDWPLWVSVSVRACLWFSMGISVNLDTAVRSSTHQVLRSLGLDSSSMPVCVCACTNSS